MKVTYPGQKCSVSKYSSVAPLNCGVKTLGFASRFLSKKKKEHRPESWFHSTGSVGALRESHLLSRVSNGRALGVKLVNGKKAGKLGSYNESRYKRYIEDSG